MKRSDPLPDADRARLATIVKRDGEKAVLILCGCSRNSLRSALAGMPIYGVTRAAIRAGLAAAT